MGVRKMCGTSRPVNKMRTGVIGISTCTHPGGNPEANIKSISHRCHPILVAFVWELTKETIDLPLGCLQGGTPYRTEPCSRRTLPCPRSCTERASSFPLRTSGRLLRRRACCEEREFIDYQTSMITDEDPLRGVVVLLGSRFLSQIGPAWLRKLMPGCPCVIFRGHLDTEKASSFPLRNA